MLHDFTLVFLQKLHDFTELCLLTGMDALCTSLSDLPACVCALSLSSCQGQAAAGDQPEVKVALSGPISQGGAPAESEHQDPGSQRSLLRPR